MPLTPALLMRHAVESLRTPREQTRWVMSLELSRRDRWFLLALISVVSTIFSVLLQVFLTQQAAFPLGLMLVSPMVGAIATTSNSVITVFIVYWAGRAFGGTGGFGNTISIITWLQFILTCILGVQILLALVFPALLGPLNIMALVALGWLFCSFVAELHGFRSALNVFFGTMAISTGFIFGLYMLAGLLGLAVTGGSI